MSDRFIERPRAFCALGGALLTVGALPETVPILHTAVGCGGSIYWNQLGSTGYLGAGYCGGLAVPSSNVQERDIVFGGIERLTEQVEYTVKLVEGKLYFVLTGCTTDIIGDDIQSVVREFQSRGVEIIGAETGGFKGDGYKGYDLALQSLFRSFLSPVKKKHKVNLLGIVPGQDAFWRGNLTIIRRLLKDLGLEVNSFFLEQDSLEEIKNSADAELNIVVSEFYGVESAKTFEEVHGVPYIALPFPIGPSATEEFLRTVGKSLNISPNNVEKLISRENKSFYKYIERVADSYNDLDFQRYAVVVGDVNYAPALTKFLGEDLGWLPELTVITDDLDKEKQIKIENSLKNYLTGYKSKTIFETDGTEIIGHFTKHWPRNKGEKFFDSFSPAFVIGSHLEREFAKSIGAGHLTVSYPVGNRVVLNRGYAGFVGGLHLIEDLFSVIVAER